MKKLTKVLALLMAAALLVCCMAGCSSSGADEPAAETKTDAPAAEPAAETKTDETGADETGDAPDLSAVSANLTMGTGGESGTY